MEFSIEQFISIVQSYSALYDTGNPDYKNVEKKNQYWGEISNLVGIPLDICKRKWKSLRDQYTKYLKGSILYPDRYRSWAHAERLDFLKPFQGPSRSKKSNSADDNIDQQNNLINDNSRFSKYDEDLMIEQDLPIISSTNIIYNTINNNDYCNSNGGIQVDSTESLKISSVKTSSTSRKRKRISTLPQYTSEEIFNNYDMPTIKNELILVDTPRYFDEKSQQASSTACFKTNKYYQGNDFNKEFNGNNSSPTSENLNLIYDDNVNDIQYRKTTKRSSFQSSSKPTRNEITGTLKGQEAIKLISDLDATSMFFLSLAKSVSALPKKYQLNIKMQCMKIVNDAELQLENSESTNFNRIYDFDNEICQYGKEDYNNETDKSNIDPCDTSSKNLIDISSDEES